MKYFRNKEEKKGMILGAICFMPAFILSFLICHVNILIGVIVLILSQGLWLHSIELACRGLEKENSRLRTENEQLKKKLNN